MITANGSPHTERKTQTKPIGAALTTPHWKPLTSDNLPKQLQEYYYLLRGQSVRQEYITSMLQWRGMYESGYTHYLSEADLLGLPKDKINVTK